MINNYMYYKGETIHKDSLPKWLHVDNSLY